MKMFGLTSAGSSDDAFSGFSGFSSFFEQLFGRWSTTQWRLGLTRVPVDRVDSWSWTMAGAGSGGDSALTLSKKQHGAERGEISLTDPETGQTENLCRQDSQRDSARSADSPGQAGWPGYGRGPGGRFLSACGTLPHPAFRLEGRDLYTTLAVAPWEAALGAEATLSTLEGNVRVEDSRRLIVRPANSPRRQGISRSPK